MAVVLPTADFVTSTLSGALTAGATSFSIGTGLGIPTTGGVLEIDYDSVIAVGLDNGPETIIYTAYNSGTGAVTGVSRGSAGTTGVAHLNGAKVQCGPSSLYFSTAGVIPGTLIADDGITAAKMIYGMVRNRQGGTTGDNSWATTGTSNTDTTAKNIFIQCGAGVTDASNQGPASNWYYTSTLTVTFPTAFNKAPIVIVTAMGGAAVAILDGVPTATNFTVRGRSLVSSGTVDIYWVAIGQ